MAKIYSDAVDKNVERILVYISEGPESPMPIPVPGFGEGIYVFKDEALTQPVSTEELYDYFIKGMALVVLVDNDEGNRVEGIELCWSGLANRDSVGNLTMIIYTSNSNQIIIGKEHYDALKGTPELQK